MVDHDQSSCNDYRFKQIAGDQIMEANYYAKSADESGNKTTNQEHLKSVAELAMRFGEALSMPRLAWTAGILHDFGKYLSLIHI